VLKIEWFELIVVDKDCLAKEPKIVCQKIE